MGTIATIYNTSSIFFNAGETGTRTAPLSDTPGGFNGSAVTGMQMKDISRYNLSLLNNDTIQVDIRIMSGTTVMAAATSGGTASTMLGPWTGSSYNASNALVPYAIDFPYCNTGASKAQWDAAVVELTQTVTVSMGSDGCYTDFSAVSGYRLEFDIFGATERVVTCTTESLLNTKVAATITKTVFKVVTGSTEALTLTEGQGVIGPQVIADPEVLELASIGSVVVVGDASYPITLLDSGGIQLFTEVLNTSGSLATVNKSRLVTGATEALTNTGTPATVLHNHIAAGTTEVLALTENAATIVTDRNVNAATEVVSSVGNQATIFRGLNRNVTCTAEALAQVGVPAQVGRAQNREVTGVTEALSTTGETATVNQARPVTCASEAISQVGNSATVVTTRLVTGATESLLNTKVAATVSKVLVRRIVCATEEIISYSQPGPGTRKLYLWKTAFLWTCTNEDVKQQTTFKKSVATLFKPPSYLDWNDAFVNVFGGGKHGTNALTGNYWTDDATTLSVVGDVYYDIFHPHRQYSTLRFDGGYITKGPNDNLDPDNYWISVGLIRPDSVSSTQTIWSDRYINTGSSLNGQEFRLDSGGELNLYAWDVAEAVFLDTSTETTLFTLEAGKWYYYAVGLDFAKANYYIFACEAGGTPQLVKTKARGAGLIGTVGSDYYQLHWGYGTADSPNPFIGNMVDMAVSSVRWIDTSPDPSPQVPMRYTQINGWDTDNNPYIRNLTNMTNYNTGDIVASLGGMSTYVLPATTVGPNTAGIAASTFDYLHKLTTSYTIEAAYYAVDTATAYNLFCTTGSSSLAAGVRCTLATDGTVTFEVRRFNSTPAIVLASSPGAMSYADGTRIAVSYNKQADYFALRINGTVVASAPTTNAPDTATSANTLFYMGPYTGQTSEFEGNIRNVWLMQYDKYGVTANHPDFTNVSHHYQIVQKDRVVIASGAIVCVGNPADISNTPARTVSGAVEVLAQVGNQATIDIVTEFPRDVVGTTEVFYCLERTARIGRGRTITCTTESLATSGTQATLVFDRLVTSNAEVINSFGSTAQIFKGTNRDVSCLTEDVSTAGSAAITRDRLVGGLSGGNLLSETPSTIRTGRGVGGQSEVLELAGSAAITRDRLIVSTVGHLTVYENPAIISRERNVRSASVQLQLVGTPATADQGRGLHYFPESLVADSSPATIGRDIRGVVICETGNVVLFPGRAHVAKMTILDPLPRYDRLGVVVLHESDSNLLPPPTNDATVRSGTGATLLPDKAVVVIRG